MKDYVTSLYNQLGIVIKTAIISEVPADDVGCAIGLLCTRYFRSLKIPMDAKKTAIQQFSQVLMKTVTKDEYK